MARIINDKSRLLLPQQETENDLEEDPREDLVGRLIEYQNYKEYSLLLTELKKERNYIILNHQLIYLTWKKRIGTKIKRLI